MKNSKPLMTVSTVIYTLAIIFFVLYLIKQKSALMALGGISLLTASIINLCANRKNNSK
ncbi:MAG TPA: hypothetical protein PLS20_05505 [Ruminococcus flavefaciens]|nr:hypothetical protein [Ruminococcus flavefaciens]